MNMKHGVAAPGLLELVLARLSSLYRLKVKVSRTASLSRRCRHDPRYIVVFSRTCGCYDLRVTFIVIVHTALVVLDCVKTLSVSRRVLSHSMHFPQEIIYVVYCYSQHASVSLLFLISKSQDHGFRAQALQHCELAACDAVS